MNRLDLTLLATEHWKQTQLSPSCFPSGNCECSDCILYRKENKREMDVRTNLFGGGFSDEEIQQMIADCPLGELDKLIGKKKPQDRMKTHKLRTDPIPFQAVWTARQTFQIRPDNDYREGECLILQETVMPAEDGNQLPTPNFTGREIQATITHIMRGPIYGLMAGWVAMSIFVFFRQRENSDSR